MFADTTYSGGPLTEEYARRRQLWEPLYEIIQMKGASETHSILSTVDEFANFEISGSDNSNLDLSVPNEDSMLDGEYIRAALKNGLKFETVRMLGGWDFTPEDVSRNPGDVGYAKGVPMGGDLKNAPAGKAPSFLVGALKDPIRGNLDHIQIVKGWLDARGETQEQIYDVVWSGDRKPGADGKVPAVGNTVNTDTAQWTNIIGAVELSTVWTDPDFDPAQRALYYARVLEIPTPRWTDYDQVFFNEDLPEEVPLTLQERCYTSPIWYSPA
jgi:hypothetical protein